VADDGRIVRTVGFFDPLPEVDLLDRMRRTGGGVVDVNIVGDPCPTGIPPGDAADGGLLVDGIVPYPPETPMATEWDDSLPGPKTLAFASRIE
jgi:hypothetical protein